MTVSSSPARRPPAATPRPASTIGVPLVAGAGLPLAFVATGLVFLLAGVAGLVARPGILLLPQTHPHLVAHVHLWLPGFLLTVAMGAVYQMMPVVLGVPLATRATGAWIHLALHMAGVTALVAGFFQGRFDAVAAGGAVVAAGMVLFTRTVWATFRAGPRRDATAWCFPLSAAWLLLTVALGTFMAANRWWSLLDAPSLALLRAHAHLGLVGFFLTLLLGATFHLVPMFTMGALRRPRLVAASVACAQAGLLLLVVGWLAPTPALVRAGATGLAASLAFSGGALRATLRARTRRPLEPGLRAFLTGLLLLAVSAPLGIALLPGLLPADRGAVVYGIVIIPAGLAFAVLGMLCKIVPFLVWMRAYGPLVGRETVPAATRLGSRRLQIVWFVLHLAAISVLAPAAALGSPTLAHLGAWLLAAAIGAFGIDVVRVLDHLRRPHTTPLHPSSSQPSPP